MTSATTIPVDTVGGDLDARTRRLFDPLKPLYRVAIVLGVVPVTVGRRPRLSFHPLRSTLAWVLILHSGTLASVVGIWYYGVQVIAGGSPLGSYAALPGVLGIAHTANVALLAAFWCEAHRYKEVFALARTLVSSVDGDVLGTGLWQRRLGRAWYWLVGVVVLGPFTVMAWHLGMAPYDTDHPVLRHVRLPGHMMAHLLLLLYAAGVSNVFYVLEDVAVLLARRLAQVNVTDPDCYDEDAASRQLRPATLLRHRRAWLSLRDLLQATVFAPVTVTLGSALMVVNAVLCLYHCVNCAMVGLEASLIRYLALASLDLGFLFAATCSAADGAVIAVNKFAKAFELIEPDSVSDYAFAREVSREALSHKLTPVCVGGYWYLSRQTVSSVCLMVIAYLIVICEFRQQRDLANAAFFSDWPVLLGPPGP